MAKFEFKGLDEYVRQLNQLDEQTTPTLKKAVYEGTRIIADEIRQSIKEIKNITPQRREGLLKSLGTAKIVTEKGVTNTKVGFVDYNNVITAKFPKGEPNALIARSIIHGTKGTGKSNFVKKAVRKAKPEAEEAMKVLILAEISETTKRKG